MAPTSWKTLVYTKNMLIFVHSRWAVQLGMDLLKIDKQNNVLKIEEMLQFTRTIETIPAPNKHSDIPDDSYST